MTEKELIAKIKELQQIKPNEEWVVLVKTRILGEETKTDRLAWLSPLFFKPLLAGGFVIALLAVIFTASQSSLPGDLLYPLKKLTEKSQVLLVAPSDLPRYNLERANKRLEEINKIVQAKGTEPAKKIEPVMNEFQENISEAAKTLAKVQATSSDPTIIKRVVEQTKRLEENKQKVEKLGVKVGETTALDNTLANLVLREIEKLKETALSETQEELFKDANRDYENGDYAQALEKILLLTYPPR